MAYLKHIEYSEGVNIARGLVRGTIPISKFGFNPTISNSGFETVWDGSNVYTYTSTPAVATVASDDSDDNGGTVTVEGLDASYNLVTETLIIGGSAGSVLFKRVFRASLITANTGTSNVGTVTVTVDSVAVAKISETRGQTLMTIYTIPAGYTGYLLQLDTGCQKDLEHEIVFVIRSEAAGAAWQTKSFITTRGGFTEKEFKLPVSIPEKHDIEVRAKASATSAVSAGFELLLVSNDFKESRRT
tara:strand:- start:1493 stop:2224 length:732 start_codon:yes stop_codon:yes gene_type:complete